MQLRSDFALLDVKRGRRQLDKMIDRHGSNHDLASPIPVVIRGYITGRHGRDDGISQEFTVRVVRVDVEQ